MTKATALLTGWVGAAATLLGLGGCATTPPRPPEGHQPKVCRITSVIPKGASETVLVVGCGAQKGVRAGDTVEVCGRKATVTQAFSFRSKVRLEAGASTLAGCKHIIHAAPR